MTGPRLLSRHLAAHRGALAMVLGLVVVTGASLGQPSLIRWLVGEIEAGCSAFAGVAAMLAVVSVLSGRQRLVLQQAGESLVLRLRIRMLEHFPRVRSSTPGTTTSTAA